MGASGSGLSAAFVTLSAFVFPRLHWPIPVFIRFIWEKHEDNTDVHGKDYIMNIVRCVFLVPSCPMVLVF